MDIIMKQKIEKAIMDGMWLRFDYVDSKMEITRRVVEPGIVTDTLVTGRDVRKDAVRQFAFEGIQKLEVIEKGQENVKPV